jgi:type I protein arginine methyltransferase
MTYSLSGFGSMIKDTIRMDAYAQALRQTIKAESVVLDIGTGTGIHALLACQFGAKHVYAIEPNDSIQVARSVAKQNSFADRITFIQDISTNISLPTPADVIVSDLRGVLPLFQQHIPSLIDARSRLLAPNGVLIPQCDTIWLALVETPSLYEQFAQPWDSQPFDLNMQPVKAFLVNQWIKAKLTPDQLLSAPQKWAVIDYRTISSPNVNGSVSLTAQRDGTAYGVAAWFDTTLTDGAAFSNAPEQPEAVYGRAFFPFTSPIEVKTGDTLKVTLKADLVSGDYMWSWQTEFSTGSDRKRTYKQSTFYGAPLSLDALHKRAASFIPHINIDGQIDRFVLEHMTGTQTLETISRDVAERFPDKFPHWEKALTYVSELSAKYSR